MAERRTMRCASASTARGEDLIATASRVGRWLLVEQPGPWGRDAPVDSHMPADVASSLCERARRHDVRVVVIRRSPHDEPGPRRAYLVRSGRQHRWIEQLDVSEQGALLEVDLAAVGEEPPGIGRPGPAAVHLVCTNGRHDPCCADLGRPVVRALRETATPEVWECSHIGGDRFAANVVVLPAGVYYGRVPPERAADLIAELAGGLLHLDHYRGRCFLPPFLQAAELLARRALDERRLDALPVRSSSSIAEQRREVVFGLDGGGGLVVTVERERGEPNLLTCDSAQPAAAWRYRLVDVQPSEG